jgi:hypothetical protein
MGLEIFSELVLPAVWRQATPSATPPHHFSRLRTLRCRRYISPLISIDRVTFEMRYWCTLFRFDISSLPHGLCSVIRYTGTVPYWSYSSVVSQALRVQCTAHREDIARNAVRQPLVGLAQACAHLRVMSRLRDAWWALTMIILTVRVFAVGRKWRRVGNQCTRSIPGCLCARFRWSVHRDTHRSSDCSHRS